MTGALVLVLRLLALAALYAFLGFALWIMWQSLRRAVDAANAQQVAPLGLEIRKRGHAAANQNFRQAEVIVGRDPRSDLALNDKAVSSRHAKLSYHHGHWWIDDLGSSNGTRLNRDPVLGATVLVSGDEIKCGATRLLVRLPTEPDLELEDDGDE